MTTLLALYVLAWPTLTLAVLVLICRAVLLDYRQAREGGKHELV